MKNTFTARGIALAVLLGAVLWYVLAFGNPPANNPPPPADGVPEVQKMYVNTNFEFSFRYPADYVLDDKGNIGTGHRGHWVIILTDSAVGAPPENSEGPPTITIDIFQNLEGYDALTWVKDSNDSNFKLGDGTYDAANVAGVPAITYRASGLYESNNIVFANGDAIYKLTVNWLTPEDQIVKDFEVVKNSFIFAE